MPAKFSTLPITPYVHCAVSIGKSGHKQDHDAKNGGQRARMSRRIAVFAATVVAGGSGKLPDCDVGSLEWALRNTSVILCL